MKTKLLSILSLALVMPFCVNAQNKALKISADEESLPYQVAHVMESPTLTGYLGSNDPDSSMVVNADGPWTVEAWVKPDALDANFIFLSGGNTQLRLQHFTNHPGEWWAGTDYNAVGLGTCGRLDGGEFDDVFGDPGYIAEVGEWQHLAVVFDKYTISLIVNGEDEYYYTYFHNSEENYTGYDAMAYAIGDNGTGWMSMPNLEMDDYRVWNIAREIDDIKADMVKVVPEDTNGLIASYTFDADPADTIYNAVDNSRHMLINEDVTDVVSYVNSTAPGHITAVSESNVTSFSVYPNPTTEIINIDGVDCRNAYLTIIDISGSVVMEEIMEDAKMDVSILQTGIYFLKISTGNETYTSKFSVK